MSKKHSTEKDKVKGYAIKRCTIGEESDPDEETAAAPPTTYIVDHPDPLKRFREGVAGITTREAGGYTIEFGGGHSRVYGREPLKIYDPKGRLRTE